ncbi:MAG TPA: PKD domain-containing protein [Bacteroidia bacterium]|nr:PKD domain-containing protein [Bacteroidia bacterium]
MNSTITQSVKKYLNYAFFGAIFLSGNAIGQNAASTVKSNSFSACTNPKGGTTQARDYKINWTKKPFDHKLFIENKGQFDTDIHATSKILFQARLGDVAAYFTNNGITYRYNDVASVKKKFGNKPPDPDQLIGKKIPIYYLTSTWEGANPNVSIEAKEEESYYYTYPKGTTGSIKTNIFKKLLYQNIYQGIDIEYTFPEGDKTGFKYSIIVHPGADLSKVKLLYSGNKGMLIDAQGEVIIKSGIGELTEHAPVSFYQGGASINSAYVLNGNEESFKIIGSYDNTQTVVIDPWVTNPNFTAPYDKAYDVDYDQFGNVYAYGGTSPYQLTKFNAAGVQQWTYVATPLDLWGYYGDFCVDKVTGTSYATEGFNGSGAHAVKVNTLGAQVAVYPGNASMLEMWRLAFNSCTRQIVIGGGGTNSPNTQAAMLDTNMVTINPVNPLATASCCRDVCLIALDPVTSVAYMAVAQSTGPDDLMALPVPALTPANYIAADAYTFQEVFSVTYVSTGAGEANGMNGMAASPNWLYMYDGATLTKVNKLTGAAVATKAVTGTSFQWGGLDADACDNVYVGENSAVQIYSPALSLISTIALTNTVYDVVLGPNFSTLYAGGNGYVSSVNITSAPSVTITEAITPTTCSACVGKATPTLLLCGAPPATTPTYLWSNGQTTQTATGLCKATYTVTMTLGCGDVFKDTVTITSGGSGGLNTTQTQTNIKCFGATNGSATVTPTNGTAPYTYVWSNGGSGATVNGLSAGTYSVVASDASCLSDTSFFTITQPTQLRDSIISTTAVTCNGGSDGTATVGVKGGTAPYTYSWAPSGGAGATGTGFAVGTTYTVTVTDANGCTNTATATVTQPALLRDSISATTNVTCYLGTNGTATVGAKGGNGGFTYSWSTVPIQTTVTATNLSAGSYTVTVTDSKGCTNTAIATITQPAQMRDSIIAITNELCFGSSTGSATVGVKGGTGTYTFSWTTVPIQTTATASNLSVGTYTVTVSDANLCSTTTHVTISQPAQLRDSIVTSSNVKCFGGNTGSATVGAANGSTPYTYNWTTVPAQTTATATNLSAGTYTVTVTDANLCTNTATVTITQPAKLTVTAAGFAATCNDSCNGQTAVIPAGGTTPYNYLWEPSGNVNASQTKICAGTDSIYVTDANGCKADTAVTVTKPTAITITTSATTANCGLPDGSATAVVGGGTGPGYTYLWSNLATTPSITNVAPGSYCVTVTDANKCVDTACVTVPNIPGEVASISGTTNVTCNGGNDGTATATQVGGIGPFSYSWNTVPPQLTQTATGLSAGSYTVTVTDAASGCQSTAVATITEPALVVTTPGPPQTICNGQSATMSVASVGGTGPYTYTWNPGGLTGATVTVSPTVTTTYTITTTDVNACPGAQVTIVITVNPPLSIVASPTRAMCPGGNVTLSAVAAGGDGTYTYNWMPGNLSGASVNVSPAVTTIYTVTVNDGCGTPAATATETVILDPLPVVSFTADTTNGCYPVCINFKDMSTITSGGLNKWQWTFGNGGTSGHQDTTYCYMTPGVYTVGLTVTSDSGCSSSQTVPNMITVYNHPTAKFTASPQPATIIDPTINFTDQSTDDYGIVNWAWTFGDPLDGTSLLQNPVYTYADTGTYCPRLIVTNKYACVDTVTECIVIDPFFTLYIPNAFSPNGDGVNDIFTAKGTYVCGFQMYIFDRWGMQLFYTEDIDKGWNGTVNGGQIVEQEDAYIYLIYAIDCIQHKKHSYIGKVSIIK